MIGKSFPISEYYRDQVVDAHTLSRTGNWWTALLVIADPRSSKRFWAYIGGRTLGGIGRLAIDF